MPQFELFIRVTTKADDKEMAEAQCLRLEKLLWDNIIVQDVRFYEPSTLADYTSVKIRHD